MNSTSNQACSIRLLLGIELTQMHFIFFNMRWYKITDYLRATLLYPAGEAAVYFTVFEP